ncbi:MAG: 50S ribosomal protein L33 [Candidatus Hodgkinia cicadicola]
MFNPPKVNRRRRRSLKIVKLFSTIKTGRFYITSTKSNAKLSFRKFDARALVHCLFRQSH